jgi:hypothetical protein
MRRPIFVLGFILLSGCVSQYGYDNQFSPNWDNRHAKFFGQLIDGRVGREYRGGCPSYCQMSSVDADTVRYTFVDHPSKGCTYWYNVSRATNVVASAQYEGSKEACSLTLN